MNNLNFEIKGTPPLCFPFSLGAWFLLNQTIITQIWKSVHATVKNKKITVTVLVKKKRKQYLFVKTEHQRIRIISYFVSFLCNKLK